MPAAITDKFSKTFNSVNPNVARVNASRAAGVTTLACDNLAGWPTDTVVHFSTYRTGTGGAVTAGTQIDWKGIVSGNNVTSLTRVAGATDAGSSINDIVELNPTASWANDLAGGLLVQHKQDGSHSAITADSAVISGNVSIAGTLTIGGSGSGGWDAASGTVSAVTYNGNRSYDLTTSNDNTGLINPGMRLRTTSTVAGPTQSTSLNGTTQYWSKAAPAGMTFTDDFVVGAWVKMSSYAGGDIVTRYNGTSGWRFDINPSGQIELTGYNGAFANRSAITSYQSIPLNKWVHVAAQLDMSAFTATSTTSYIMIDGIEVPSSVSRAGTNPLTLVQAGNLEVGSTNGGTTLFPGKIAQAFVSSAKITQANVRTLISQGLTSALITANSIVSAYSFDGNANDLNTTNANNLTASGSATATNADSFRGGQASGTISSTLDYGIVQKVTASTVTVQVAEGCTIPTSGGVSAVSYSTYKSPYGFPGQVSKWSVDLLFNAQTNATSAPAASTYVGFSGNGLSVPVGEWRTVYKINLYTVKGTQGIGSMSFVIGTGTITGQIPESGAVRYGFTTADDMYTVSAEFPYSSSAQSTLYPQVYTTTAGAGAPAIYPNFQYLGSSFIRVINAYL